MKRILLTLIFCSPLLISLSKAHSEALNETYTDSSIAEKYGPVDQSETLWAISTKLRPDTSVSVYQTLVAIYKLNPDVFRNGDINQIIPRSVLTVPEVNFVAQQTIQEAYNLLKPASEATQKNLAFKVQGTDKKQTSSSFIPIDSKVVERLKEKMQSREEALESAERKITIHENELLLLNEELSSLSISNQLLKSQLQPLTEQVESLSQQIGEEISLQKELQALIDQYKVQIDNFIEPPFTGDDPLNQFLQKITSSLSALLLTILTPIFILLIIFLFILRRNSRINTIDNDNISESHLISAAEANRLNKLKNKENEQVLAPIDDVLENDEYLNKNTVTELSDKPEYIDPPHEIKVTEQSNIVTQAEKFESQDKAPTDDEIALAMTEKFVSVADNDKLSVDINKTKTSPDKIEEIETNSHQNTVSKEKNYIEIDSLLDTQDIEDMTEEEFDLELGLDEFPNVLDFNDFDSDDDGISNRLDLARAYLEIDDKNRAKKILVSLLDKATDEKLEEVNLLLSRIK